MTDGPPLRGPAAGRDGTAADVVARLAARGQSVATAESLTGGLVAAALTDIPGASAVFRGGVVAYQSDVKTSAVGVDAELLARYGVVSAQVASALADGVRRRLGATWGIGTTGVAGPALVDGHPVGTVFIAVAGPQGALARGLRLPADRSAIRQQTVVAALALLAQQLAGVG